MLGEVELGWRLLPNEFIAVTGTNGKTTTVQLLGHIHREAGIPVAVAGNVGDALTGLVGSEALSPGTIVVCEVSSFQLEDAVEFAPEGAVLLNVKPDHLDRHGTFEDYLGAKLRVFARQGNEDVAVAPVDLGVEDLGGCARRVPFGPGGELDDRAGHLWWDERPLLAHDEIRLRGAHNRANAAAAAAIALARGIEPDAVRAALRSFAGVEHRLEEVAHVDGRAVRQRLQGDERRLDARRAGEFRQASTPDPRRPRQGPGLQRRCVAARWRTYLIGAAAAQLEREVGGERCGTLAVAVARARAAALPGDVVLLSPACASFDQFDDYEARGRAFKELV